MNFLDDRLPTVGDYVRGDNAYDPAWHAKDPRRPYVQHVQILGFTPSERHRLQLSRGERTVLVPLTAGEHSVGDVTARVWYRGRGVLVEVVSPVASWYWRVETVGPAPADPLDVAFDGVTLRVLLECDERARRENHVNWKYGSQRTWTPTQRAAVSAHWSAQLRAKVASGPSLDGSTYGQRLAAERRERERARVLVDLEVE